MAAMEDEFRKLYAEALALPDEIELVPNWPSDYQLHDAAICTDPIALESILDNATSEFESDSESDSDSDSDKDKRFTQFLNKVDSLGRTPLHWACGGDHEHRSDECVRLLTEAGACIDLSDKESDSPVHLCAHRGGMQLLAELKADLGILDKRARTPLVRAVERGNVGVVSFLTSEPWKKSTRINDVDIDGRTALTVACEKGFAQIVALLLPHADLEQGSPPAVVAATVGRHIDIIRLIATRGPHALQQKDANGWTALHWAADMGCGDAVQELTALSPALLPIFDGRSSRNSRNSRDSKSGRNSRNSSSGRRSVGSTSVVGVSEGGKGGEGREGREGGERGERGESHGGDKEHAMAAKRKDIPIPTPMEMAIARGHIHVVKMFQKKGSKEQNKYGDSVAVAQGYTGSQYGIYGSWEAALKVLEGENGDDVPPPPAHRVLNFRLFSAEDWKSAEQYVELRSYARKRDEDIVARLEEERIAAEKEAARKEKERQIKAEMKAEKKKRREEKAMLNGGKVGRGGGRGRNRSKSPTRSSTRSSKSPQRGRKKTKGRRSKSPDKKRYGSTTELERKSKSNEEDSNQTVRRGSSKSPDKKTNILRKDARKRKGKGKEKSPQKEEQKQKEHMSILDEGIDLGHATAFLNFGLTNGTGSSII